MAELDHNEINPYVPVRDVIECKLFPGVKLLGGQGGLDNPSHLIAVLETPNGLEWLQGGEIVVTAGFAFTGEDDGRQDIIRLACKNHAAAVCVKEGRYFGEISNALISQANELNMPLLSIPQETVYSELASNYYNHLYAIYSRDLIRQNRSYYDLLSIQSEKTTPDDLVEKLSSIIGCEIKLKNHYKEENLLVNFNHVDTSPKIHRKEGRQFIRFVIKTAEILAYLDVYTAEELNLFQIRAIDYASSVIKNMLLSNQISNWSRSELNQTLGVILLNSLSKPDPIFVSNLTDILHWQKECFYTLCVRFCNQSEDEDSKRANHSLAKAIRKFLEDSSLGNFLFSETSVEMLLFVNAEQSEIKEIFHVLFNNTKRLSEAVHIGCSASERDLFHLENQLQQARTASLHSSDFSLFEDLGNERYLSSFGRDAISHELFGRIITRLRDYDLHHDGKLMETLEAFFASDMNRSETAERLFIHPETLRYRLNKIQELTASSPYTSSGIFQLMLALGIQHLY